MQLIIFLSVIVCALAYTAPGTKFDLSKWHLQLPVNGVQTVSSSTNPPLSSYSSKWFYLDADGKMTFTTITSGDHTSGSQYARSELREVYSSSDDNWSLSANNGLHVLEATLEVTSCPTSNKVTTIGQIHTYNADIPVIVEMQWTDGKVRAMYSEKDSSVHKYQYFTFADTVGNGLFSYKVLLDNGKLTLQVNGKGTTADVSGWSPTQQYFKAGDYVQSNVGDVLCTAKFSALCVKHGATSCTPQVADRLDDGTQDQPSSNNLAIGLGVGLGVGGFVLIAAAAIGFFAYKKSKDSSAEERF